jgi:hypothetical protein
MSIVLIGDVFVPKNTRFRAKTCAIYDTGVRYPSRRPEPHQGMRSSWVAFPVPDDIWTPTDSGLMRFEWLPVSSIQIAGCVNLVEPSNSLLAFLRGWARP